MMMRDAAIILTCLGSLASTVTAQQNPTLLDAKIAIQHIVDSNKQTTGVNFAPKFLRLAFHDCVGGCDGCVDLDNFDNAGLDIVISALDPVVEEFANSTSGISRADIWALAALVSTEMSQRYDDDEWFDFPLLYTGRVNCEDTGTPCLDADGNEVPCSATRGPHRAQPSSDLTIHQLLDFFDQEFDFNAQEVVAIMGAHTIGVAVRENSGFDGEDGWVRREEHLDNDYYDELVGGHSPNDSLNQLYDAPNWNLDDVNNSNLAGIPTRFQWERRRNNGRIIMLNVDIALVRDLTDFVNPSTGDVECGFKRRRNGQPACPMAENTMRIAAQYKFSNELWLSDFRNVLNRMLVNGYDSETGLEVVEELQVAGLNEAATGISSSNFMATTTSLTAIVAAGAWCFAL